MKLRTTPIAHAVSLAVLSLGMPGLAHAQQAEAKKDDTQIVQVTGIRASLQASINSKKNADTNVEVLTADDVGKMPDKNIADALSRLAGVNVQYGGGGAFDEAERLAIRGTPPSLNLITMNGHALSSGDWHVGDQGGSRSVGFGLMPSQILGRSIVYKSSQANIMEGGLAGTVDIQTRNPLDFKNPLTGELSVGAVYAQLAGKTDPQVSGLVNWKNADSTFGVMAQLYKEDRHLRRDGQEGFGYGVISAAQAATAGDATLTGKRIPLYFNTAEFEGVRKRSGGFLALQWKPTADFELLATGFSSKLKATNYNASGYAHAGQQLASGAKLSNWTLNGDVVSGGTITPSTATTQAFAFEHIVRDGAESTSKFMDLKGKFRFNKDVSISGTVGTTKGTGTTRAQPSMQLAVYNKTVTFQQHGGDSAADWNVVGANLADLQGGDYRLLQATSSSVKSVDTQDYANADVEWRLGGDTFTKMRFGFRMNDAERDFFSVAGRYNNQDDLVKGCVPSTVLCNMPASTWPAAPGRNEDFGPNLGGNFPRALHHFDLGTLAAWGYANQNWDPVLNFNATGSFNVKEKTKAIYLMQDFEAGDFSGNFGVRGVKTDVTSLGYLYIPTTVCANYVPGGPAVNCSVPGSVSTRRGQSFLANVVKNDYTNWLPSLNVRWSADNKLVGRFGLSKSLGRPDFSQLAGALSLNDTLRTGSAGNPNLAPITSTNVDIALAYYMSPRSYASFNVFTQDIKNYVKQAVIKRDIFNVTFNRMDTYDVTSRTGVDAKLRGAEAALELPIGNGFGAIGNVTYVNSKDVDGQPLLGTSKWTYNLRGYYEDDRFTASLAYNYRTAYSYAFVGAGTGQIVNGVPTGSTYYAAGGTLSLSAGYKLSENMSINLDASNLTNPIRHTYHISENAPSNFYENGRQFWVTLRMKY